MGVKAFLPPGWDSFIIIWEGAAILTKNPSPITVYFSCFLYNMLFFSYFVVDFLGRIL